MEPRRAEGAMPQLGNKGLAFRLTKSSACPFPQCALRCPMQDQLLEPLPNCIGNSLSTASKCMRQ
jgi:hypothetical protein